MIPAPEKQSKMILFCIKFKTKSYKNQHFNQNLKYNMDETLYLLLMLSSILIIPFKLQQNIFY